MIEIGNNCKIKNSVIQCPDKMIINGVELPKCPSKCNNSTIINGKVYIDGYEWKNNQWKRTLKALWYKIF